MLLPGVSLARGHPDVDQSVRIHRRLYRESGGFKTLAASACASTIGGRRWPGPVAVPGYRFSMIRRGQHGRREMRRAEREAAKEIESDRGGYRPPDRADCHTKQWITPGDDTYRLRLQTITWRQQGRLMDFVINAQVLTAVEWETVEYVDCCHGHCHLHTRSDEPPRSISPLNSAEDVQGAYTVALAPIHERLSIIGT